MAIGYLGAFLGGLLTLLSPCSALLLPAFFAYAFPGRAQLLGRTLVFYVGLAAVLVPLGMGTSLASTLVYGHQRLLAVGAGVLLVGFGAVVATGGGFTIAPLERLRARVRGDSLAAVLALGAVSGLTGFCSGPVLGAVLTVAAASGSPVRGATLLALYAAGMAAPLFVLAACWDRFDLGRRRWLRGRALRVGRLRLHSTSLLSGLVFAGLGGLFLYAGGTGGLTRFFLPDDPGGWRSALQRRILWVQGYMPDLVVVAVLAVVLVVVAVWWLRRNY